MTTVCAFSPSGNCHLHPEPSPGILDGLARLETTPGFVPLPDPDAAAQALIDQST